MERHARFLFLGIAVGVAFIVLLESLGLAQTAKPPADVRVALVNGEAIALSEVDAILKQRPTSLSAPTAGQLRQQRLEVVTALVDDLLVRQFLRDSGPKVDPAEATRQFAALEASLKEKDKSLAEYLKENGQTEAQLKASMLMLWQLDRYVKQNTTDADLRKFWEANKDYFDKTTVRTSHIVIRLAADATPGEREKAKQKLQGLRADLLAGRIDFATAARQHSQCPSAPKGGDIGFIFRKFQNVEEAYAKAAFALKPDEVTDVVETEFGMHLIKMTERKAGTASKFEQCIEDVRDSYAEELRVALLNQLRKKAKVEITLP
jgi:parvulin-like peptidyl-prolyl isomerase